MKRDNECCGTCRYHVPDDNWPSDWICVNPESDNVADWTEYDECCDWYEPRPQKEGRE